MLSILKMLQQTFCPSFLALSFFSFLALSTANSNVYIHCSQLNFTSTTPYESNVNSLFTSIVDSASLYNFNKFETPQQSECTVYGLFQCRGDLSSPNCKDCVASALSQLKTTCAMSTGGEIQLEGCFVKYHDTSFFGVEDKMEVCRRCGPSMGNNPDVMSRIDGVLAYLVGGNTEYFRGGDYGSIQGVAQCLQDQSLSDCQDCLSEACARLKSECETSIWGDMYLGKCYIRYASEGNENLANKSDRGISKNDCTKKWIPIIGAILAGVVSIIGLTFACKNFLSIKVINLKDDVKNMKKDLDGTKGVVKNVKNDLDGAKAAVTDVKKDLDGTKAAVINVKKDLDGTKAAVIDVKKDLHGAMGTVIDVKKDLAGVKDEVNSIKKDFNHGKEVIKALCWRTNWYYGWPMPMPPPCRDLPPSDPCRYLPPWDPCCSYLPSSDPCP